jgi:medium-chain acyl-[acyl-carrier-protein] hydrolase
MVIVPTTAPNLWTGGWTPAPAVAVRLFCFPYAGGSASTFRTWRTAFPASIDVCPVHLPGRGRRWRETPFEDLGRLVAASMTGLRAYLDVPFAFFGHSFGALVGFEAARYLRRHGGPEPLALFLSACNAPHRPSPAPPMAGLPDSALLDRLRVLGGTPPEALAQPELMALYLPVVRADLTAAERYEYHAEAPLNCRITAFFGNADGETDRDGVAGWEELTIAPFTLHELSGDHFFIHTAAHEMTSAIASRLLTGAGAPASG